MAGWTCFSRSLKAWLNSLRSTIQFHGTSRQLEVIPSNSSVFSRLYRCLQVVLRLLSKNHPGLEWSPSWASGGRVIGGVEAVYAVTPVTSPCHVYILHELFFCTCSSLSSFMHCFRIARSAIAVHCDYPVTRHPLKDIATYWTRTRMKKRSERRKHCSRADTARQSSARHRQDRLQYTAPLSLVRSVTGTRTAPWSCNSRAGMELLVGHLQCHTITWRHATYY